MAVGHSDGGIDCAQLYVYASEYKFALLNGLPVCGYGENGKRTTLRMWRSLTLWVQLPLTVCKISNPMLSTNLISDASKLRFTKQKILKSLIDDTQPKVREHDHRSFVVFIT